MTEFDTEAVQWALNASTHMPYTVFSLTKAAMAVHEVCPGWSIDHCRHVVEWASAMGICDDELPSWCRQTVEAVVHHRTAMSAWAWDTLNQAATHSSSQYGHRRAYQLGREALAEEIMRGMVSIDLDEDDRIRWRRNVTVERNQRIVAAVAAARICAIERNREAGRPDRWTYRGGAVDWETGLPALSVLGRIPMCVWLRRKTAAETGTGE